MTKEKMIDKIYEVIADKTLSFGCRFNIRESGEFEQYPVGFAYYEFNGKFGYNYKGTHIIYSSSETDLTGVIPPGVDFHFGNGLNMFSSSFCYKELEKMIKNNSVEIIGHPVMIGDVLDWIEKLNQGLGEDHIKVGSSVRHKLDTKIKIIEDKREHKRLPIDDQSEECIDFVYKLLPLK